MYFNPVIYLLWTNMNVSIKKIHSFFTICTLLLQLVLALIKFETQLLLPLSNEPKPTHKLKALKTKSEMEDIFLPFLY